MHLPIDYVTLRLIWWVLMGLLLIGFAVMDGFDLGVGMLLHHVARTDDERRVVLNSIGPVWEGNQIWLILGAGAIFAAWPEIYAVSFSGFYFAMLLTLLGLILRPVGFKYRGKIASAQWRAVWDACLFIGGFVPALIFGVAIGNVLQGVPFYYDSTLLSYYTGNLFGLLNPFAILCGLVSVSMLGMHGAIFLAGKTDGMIQERARADARWLAVLTMVLFAIAGVWVSKGIVGYVLTSPIAFDAPSNPLHKAVITKMGAWMMNYQQYPLTLAAPLTAFVGATMAVYSLNFKSYKLAWLMSAICVTAVITTVGVSMFPFILPSSSNPEMSLLIWDSSSSQLTLFLMLLVAAVFLPIILLYTSWVYYVLRGKVTLKYLQQNKKTLY